MLYLHRAPAPPLDAFVESIWYCENNPRRHGLERVLPSGAAQLIINLKEDQTRVYRPESGYQCEATSGAVLSGVQSRYCVIDTAEQECVLGAAFRPGGTIPFFRILANETRDANISLDTLSGPRCSKSLRERLLEATGPQARLDVMERVLAEVFKPIGLHPAVAFALSTFTGRQNEASVADVTGRIGLSPKRFIERFKTEVGVAPKRYCRILRFQRALAHAEQGGRLDWTRIALDCGYFDQAHFIHDFRSFASVTPTGYQTGRTEFRNHVKFPQFESVSL